MVGFFKQGYVKSMPEQVQQCKLTLTQVVKNFRVHVGSINTEFHVPPGKVVAVIAAGCP